MLFQGNKVSHSKGKESGCLFGDNAVFIEEMYDLYKQGSQGLPASWHEFFSCFPEVHAGSNDKALVEDSQDLGSGAFVEIERLVNFFRSYGHFAAKLDPLGMHKSIELDYEGYIAANGQGKSAWYHGLLFQDVLKKLKNIYCGKVGFEFMHICDSEVRYWLREEIENLCYTFSPEEKKEILRHLQETEIFEQFLHLRYPGYKRFSIEGGDSLIPSIEKIIDLSPKCEVHEVVIGMAHRGRLNVLTKVMKKSYVAMMREFSGGAAYPDGLNVSGDVKYHLGYSCDRELQNGQVVHLSLTNNPSHLEAVNPVVLGRVKAKIDRAGVPQSVLGVLVHGDASFIGQGVVSEGFTLSELPSYGVQGVVHIIVNNQVGFTTNPEKSRSSFYCSDIAKMIDAPIFHVNGDDPEMVVAVTGLAMQYRHKFKKDVVVDIVCYRRFGHNEGDEPMFTQPMMYDRIAQHKTVASAYAEQLVNEKVMLCEEVEGLRSKFREKLEADFVSSSSYVPDKADWFDGYWKGLRYPNPGNFEDYLSDTGVSEEVLLSLAEALCKVPQGFNVNKKVARLFATRLKNMESDIVDWGMGETLAFASLLKEGFRIRLSGEDCGRGTFSHRHARLIDQITESEYIPLNNLGVEQEQCEIIDSPLSEYAVLGFEYGYSIDSPNVLVIWEAQFGDFANGAQIIIDQFIASSETKWLRSSGLVLLLPHGYEGQGPEHSSARIERYLQLCAEDNMQVVNCTTPANYFHVLRRQMHRDFRKPLVVLTPKSLLRHKMAVSKRAEFLGGFLPVIGEVTNLDANQVRKVVVCSGKVYYDLLEAREANGDSSVALLRLEQYYPFPSDLLKQELMRYLSAEVVWCQEEPINMGGWSFVRPFIEESMCKAGFQKCTVTSVARSPSASTAVGYVSTHMTQQRDIIDQVFR